MISPGYKEVQIFLQVQKQICSHMKYGNSWTVWSNSLEILCDYKNNKSLDTSAVPICFAAETLNHAQSGYFFVMFQN